MKHNQIIYQIKGFFQEKFIYVVYLVIPHFIGESVLCIIDHFRITAIWPGDRIRRPEHSTENEVRRCSCDESV